MIPDYSQAASNRTILSVSELNRSVANMLESEFSWIWVEGEISNLAKPASGHIYFSLKDSGAQIRCAMFKSRIQDLRFRPENGLNIVVRGKVSLYEARGDYQIIVDKMEEAGDGVLQKQFEALKQKLDKQGLFAENIKQVIPEHPDKIGVITSRSGAAIQDVLSVIERRFPSIPVILFPVPVQGSEAAPAICNAIRVLDKHKICDVLLIVRGGGSLEDLWAFNEESVARAIFKCSIPVVSGVGHEVDFTITDFVADFRAATPTAAAEKVTPDQEAYQTSNRWFGQRLLQLINEAIENISMHANHLQKRLEQQHPSAVLNRLSQRVDDFDQRLRLTWKNNLQQYKNGLLQLNTQLLATSPAHKINHLENKVTNCWQQFRLLMNNQLHQKRLVLSGHASTLNVLSPLQTLSRGYSITYDKDGNALKNASRLKRGDTIKTRLYKNDILSIIKSIKK